MIFKRFRVNEIVGILLASTLILTNFATPSSQASLFGQSSDTKKNVASIVRLASTETRILNEWGALTGANYKDDYTTGVGLIKLLPKVNSFIAQLDQLSPKDLKFQAAIDIWIDGWNKQAEGLALSIDAIDSQDYSKMAKANTTLAAGRKTIKKAQQALRPFLNP